MKDGDRCAHGFRAFGEVAAEYMVHRRRDLGATLRFRIIRSPEETEVQVIYWESRIILDPGQEPQRTRSQNTIKYRQIFQPARSGMQNSNTF